MHSLYKVCYIPSRPLYTEMKKKEGEKKRYSPEATNNNNRKGLSLSLSL